MDKTMNCPPKIDVFEMLLTRLKWPLRPVRLMATRQLAELLSTGNSQYINSYYYWLAQQNTETELVDGLVVLGLLDNLSYFKDAEVTKHINSPSILADNYLESIYGMRPLVISWEGATSGTAPAGIQMETRFKGGIGSFVAPLLRTLFIDLENEYEFPFMEQWSWEWYCLDRNLEYRSPSPRYFADELRGQTIRGEFEVRESDVFKSSFLRTLHFAVVEWGMPLSLASHYANIVAPANLDLARVETSPVPVNWPRFDNDTMADKVISGESVESIFSKLLSPEASEVIVAAHGHVYISKMRWIEAEYLFGLVDVNSVVSAEDFHKALRSWDHPMPALRWPRIVSSHLIKYDKNANTAIRPIAIRLYPELFSWPRYHISMITRGLYAPLSYLFGDAIQCIIRNDYIAYEVNGKQIGRMIYWYDPWSSSHPVNASGAVGTALFIDKDVLEVLESKTKYRFTSSVHITHHSRHDEYGEWETNSTNWII